jgi:putative restriction endonuclease
VLRAYAYRCAFSGFRAALGGTYFGCEAAHVQWHSYQGPDFVSNRIALEPTIHKLLDAGAWSLTDDRRILVSVEFTGTDSTLERIRERHGKPLRSPLPGEPSVSPQYIQWHREPDLGGVLRQPALPLWPAIRTTRAAP